MIAFDVRANVSYNGERGPDFVSPGIGFNLRFEGMPPNHTCAVGQLEMDRLIPYGGTDSCTFRVLCTASELKYLVSGTPFTLTSGPRVIVAAGEFLEVSRVPDRTAPRQAPQHPPLAAIRVAADVTYDGPFIGDRAISWVNYKLTDPSGAAAGWEVTDIQFDHDLSPGGSGKATLVVLVDPDRAGFFTAGQTVQLGIGNNITAISGVITEAAPHRF